MTVLSARPNTLSSTEASSRVPVVVAVIVTWRTEAITRELLRHLEKFLPVLDLILVDCGQEVDDIGAEFPRVTVFRPGNLGYAGGNNLGIREALARERGLGARAE